MGESKIEASNNISLGESRCNSPIYQNVIIMRHGERIDHFDAMWASKAARKWDPELVVKEGLGKERAFNEGRKMRSNIGFPIHRVIVSPFLRCLQTATEVVSALCAVVDGDDELLNISTSADGVQIDSSKIKVSIEYGLFEMLNHAAISPEMAPEDGKFDFDISHCESILPAGTIDRDAKPLYKEMPKWGETVADALSRYLMVAKALADKYPSENLLLVTHAPAVFSAWSNFTGDTKSKTHIDYCGYVHGRRPIYFGENQLFSACPFEAVSQNGIIFKDMPQGNT